MISKGIVTLVFFISDIIIDNNKKGSVTINNNFDISKKKKIF